MVGIKPSTVVVAEIVAEIVQIEVALISNPKVLYMIMVADSNIVIFMNSDFVVIPKDSFILYSSTIHYYSLARIMTLGNLI